MKTLLFYKKLFIVLIGLYVVLLFSCANRDLSDPIPIDNSVIIEPLDNGMTVYLHPFEYVDYYDVEDRTVLVQIAVRAGMIHETDEEIGLAHFLEHMAFNSTEKYNRKEIASMERELGVVFGAHSNAYTSLNETIYMLSLHNPTPERLEKLFDIMSQRTMHITFDPEEVEKERGVVLAEEQLYLSNEDMLEYDYLLDKQIEGSLYADRSVIGHTEIVETATPEQLKKYYDTWYTPSNMAIAVLGDIKTVQVMPLIQKYFGTVQKPESPPQPTVKMFEPYSRKFDVYINPSSFTTKIAINNVFRKKDFNAVSSIRDEITNNILTYFLQYSFWEYLQAKKYDSALFNISSTYDTPLIQKESVYESSIYLEIDKNRIEEGVQEIQNFLVNVHKALKSDKFNSEILIDISEYTEPYKTSNRYQTPEEMANSIVNDFIFGKPILDYSKVRPYIKTIEKQITQEDVLRVFEEHIYNPANQLVFVSTSSEQNPFVQDTNSNNTAPRTVDLEHIFSQNIASNINLFSENQEFIFEDYVNFRPAGKVVKEEVYPDTVSGSTIYVWTLSNGIKVVFHSTITTEDFEVKVINTDILKHRYYVGNINIPEIFTQALEYSYIKDILIYDFLSIEDYYDTYLQFDSLSYYLLTNNKIKSLKALFEQLYVMNNIMNVQEVAFNRAKNIYLQNFYSSIKDPRFYANLVKDSLIYKNHPNFIEPMNEKSVIDISMDDMNKAADTFFNSKDMIFFLHGDANNVIVKDLVEEYIASLPTKDSDPLDYSQLQYPIEPYEGEVIRLDNSPIATINYEYFSLIPQDELQTTDKEQLIFQFASMYLQNIIDSRIREDLGQIYYSEVLIDKDLDSSNLSGEYSLNISFNSDVEFADSLFAEVKTILEKITSIDTTLLEEVRNTMKSLSAEYIQYENDSIDGLIERYNILPWFISKVQKENIIEKITAQEIESAFRKVLQGEKIAFITFPLYYESQINKSKDNVTQENNQ